MYVNPIEKLREIEDPEGEYLKVLSTAAKMTEEDNAPFLKDVAARANLSEWTAYYVLRDLKADGFDFFRTPQEWVILKDEMPREEYDRLMAEYQDGLSAVDRAKMYGNFAVAGVGAVYGIAHFLWENRDKIGVGFPKLRR